MTKKREYWLILYTDVSVTGSSEVSANEVIAENPADWLIATLKLYPNTVLRGAMPIDRAQYTKLKELL